jgi:sialidase-1
MGLWCLLILSTAWSAAVPARCQAELDSYCNNASGCSWYPQYAPFFARHDISHKSPSPQWRCYPASALSPDHSHYVHNASAGSEEHICSRNSQLLGLLQQCEAQPTPPPAPSPPQPKVIVTTVFKGGHDGCVMYRTPSFVTTGNGTLVAFTQCRQISHSDEGPQSLHMKRSHDGGASWSSSTVLPFAADADLTTQHRAQTVYDNKTGSIFLFDDARPIDSPGICAVTIWRSDDLGARWVLVTNLTDNKRNTGSGLATGIQLPSGRLVLAQRAGCNGNSMGTLGAHALWSDDHGESWVAGLPTSGGAAVMNECQLARLSNGSLYMNARTSSIGRVVSLSADNGRTWSAPRAEPALSDAARCEASLIAVYPPQLAATIAPAVDAVGAVGVAAAAPVPAVVMYFSHPQSADASRKNLTVRRSLDDGATWPRSEAVLVWEGPSAYSCLGTTLDGAVAVLWEKDGTDLGFARITGF